MEMTRRQNPAAGIPRHRHTVRRRVRAERLYLDGQDQGASSVHRRQEGPVLSFGGGWGDLMDHFVPDLRGKVYVDGAGHWVQMGRPEAVTDALLGFLVEFA